MTYLAEFITKATLTHNGRYNYDKATQIYDKNKVTITCPVHGDFLQNMYRHMTGTNCPNCVIDRKRELFKLPLESFIKRANIIHDNKYDYSKVEYNNTAERVTIICPIHGEFEQFASGHLTGYGCRPCSVVAKRLTTEMFIERSRVKHGDFYDYSKVDYKDSREKVTIICPKHGDFKQIANVHMSGSNCPTCVIENKKLTREEFIEKAISIHGDRYDYSKVDYKYAIEKVIIVCESHGDFTQIPNSHLGGAGCPHCHYESSLMSQERFIQLAKGVHGDKYDYSKTVFKGSKGRITVTCRKHGDFEQLANTHLYSGGCYTCGREGLRFTQEEVILKATEIHKGRYTYDKTIYRTIKEDIIITCPTHGDFSQRASTHLGGSGCKSCWISKGELAIETILIEMGINYSREYTLPDYVNRYRYDFYLPENRVLIEFHGIQHYEPIDFYGGVNTLEYVKGNDELKRVMAKRFKYRLLEINYKTFESLSDVDFKKYLVKKLAILGIC